MYDLRGDRRVQFDRRAWCEHQRLTLYLPVANVSRGGMFLQTSTPFEPGETLRVCFPATDADEKIVALVEIVWSCRAGRGSGVGCRVLNFVQGEAAYGRLVAGLEAA
jgi:Tfp pilus assembly protein PilZ